MTRLLSKIYIQLLIGIAAGILIGCLFPAAGPWLKPFADVFIKLIKVLLAPIIFATVVIGIARMGDIKAVGRVGVVSLVYFEVVSALALVIGLVVVNIVRPGAAMNIDPAKLDTAAIASYTGAAHKITFSDFLQNIIPTSAVGAFLKGNMLQVILISILIAIALSGPKNRPFIDMLQTFLDAMFGIVRIVMYLAPLAAMGSMAFIVGQYGPRKLLPYLQLIACLYVTSALFIVCILGPIARLSGISL